MDEPICIEIAGELISVVRHLGISKARRLSYLGYLGSRPVKIYQTFSSSHAQFIRKVSEHVDLREYFPEVLHISGEYVIAEWVQGCSIAEIPGEVDPDTVKAIVRIQTSFHTQDLGDEGGETGFDYIDFLEKRLHRYRGVFPVTDSLSKILCVVHDRMPFLEPRLSHPDVTPRNLILEEKTKQLKLIDNELLTYSSFYWLDLFNTCHALTHTADTVAKYYLDQYMQHMSIFSLPAGWESLFVALWALRLIGTYFQAGKFKNAYRLADGAANGELNNHPVIQAIRGIAPK